VVPFWKTFIYPLGEKQAGDRSLVIGPILKSSNLGYA
jgi:hypothetical protein